ncbi:MAG: ferric reductase-like transmembrane domain-containing protein [Bacteroidetes bacterium]|nr:ferric reductase-like transmembrane domain-containing protein [Bacteroidota bacterium]
MFGISYLDISGALGLCATALLSFNFLLGMLLSTAYKRSVYWKKIPPVIQQINIDRLHNWTAYIALFFVVLHPLFLLADKEQTFTLRDILWPVAAPKQSNIVMLGTISFYALLIIIITTQKIVKKKLGFRLWKNIHLVSYATALLFLFHGLLMDPLLKDRPTDWLDAEKFFSEFCLLLILAAMIIRIRYHFTARANA